MFALPSLRLHFKTEHVQGPNTPESTGLSGLYFHFWAYFNETILLTEEKPVVECSFITEFEDHIFVTVDADAFFFLHDLISSYIKEKDRVVRLTELLDSKENKLQKKNLFFSLEHKMYDPHHRIQI